MWYMTRDTWHVTCDMWHMTHDRWEEVNLLSKALLPSYYSLGVRVDMWHMTCATWDLTPDMWHLTYDMFHLTHRGWWTLCKNFKFLALTVWVWRFCEDSKQKDHLLNQLISEKGVCRTAPATQGLLNILNMPPFKQV